MVYILTFQNALNYGAILQCVALYKTISTIADSAVIDYRADEIEKTYKIFSLKRSAKKNLKGILTAVKTSKKRKSFEKFLSEHVQRTNTFYSIEELEVFHWDKNDIFCVGSDQVWNTDLTGQDKAYFLSFLPKEVKKISYAASTGKKVSESNIQIFQSNIKFFENISIREISICEQIQGWGIKCVRNIDPVYLLKKSDWEAMTVAVAEEKMSYVLVYSLQKSKILIDKALSYAQRNEKKLIILTEFALKKIHGAVYIESASPQEFIRYFMKADMIFTNSFHGLSLSIILNKQFFYSLLEGKENTNSRLQDLVSLFGLENRNCTLVNDMDKLPLIDYTAINIQIVKEQENARKYLIDAILES